MDGAARFIVHRLRLERKPRVLRRRHLFRVLPQVIEIVEVFEPATTEGSEAQKKQDGPEPAQRGQCAVSLKLGHRQSIEETSTCRLKAVNRGEAVTVIT